MLPPPQEPLSVTLLANLLAACVIFAVAAAIMYFC